jgi:ferredoxin-nitrite reductase
VIAHHELFDTTPVVRAAVERFYGNPAYSNLPRKHKITIMACPDACAAPEINCVGLVGTLHQGAEGFGVLVGGGLSSVPRIARDLGVFVPKEEAVDLLAAILDVWQEDLRYRMSRVKARLKFMVDDIGPEGLRERVEAKLGRPLAHFRLPELPPPGNHLGVHPQHDGRVYLGVPVRLGRLNGDQLIEVAELAGRLGGDVRITRQQNFLLTNVREHDLDAVREALRGIGLEPEAGPLEGDAIACTGEPHCNFSVTETKGRLDRLVTLLQERFGDDVAGLRLHLDGCPHACAHHWVGELGFQGTTVRDEEGVRRQAYDIFVRGGLERPAAIGRPLFRRVPTQELDDAVVGLVQGWIDEREPDETFRTFCERTPDDELGRLAGREPVRGREVAAA